MAVNVPVPTSCRSAAAARSSSAGDDIKSERIGDGVGQIGEVRGNGRECGDDRIAEMKWLIERGLIFPGWSRLP